MKVFLLLSVTVCVLFGQAEKTMYTTDINGRRIAAAASDATTDTKREMSQSINGRTVPLERTEEHVISKDGNRTTMERITKRYNPTGELMMTERVLIDRETLAGGGSSETSHVYRSDINGSLKEMERRHVDTRVQGSTTSSEIQVERPSLSGSFETAEKRSATAQKSGDREDSKETVYRRSLNGDFYPALQKVSVETKSGNTVNQQIADYELGVTGQLQLARQTVSTSTKDKAGNETREVNLYTAAVDGRVQESGAPQHIKEQQLIQRTVAPDGSIIESLSVRRPTIADPTKLGALQKISEVVCKGKCEGQ